MSENKPNPESPDTHQEPQYDGYTINKTKRRLNLHKFTIEQAIREGHFSTFTDDEERLYIPAGEVEAALEDSDLFEKVAASERIKARDVAEAMNVKPTTARARLREAGYDHHKPQWQHIRGRWELPTNLPEFRKLVHENRENRKQARHVERTGKKARRKERQEEERRRRAELRAQLVASFPAWAENERSHQMMMLHIGPPNSGKTHDALIRLGEAGSGWYLAPLRLLAWEIFDRLNQRGVPCNLLTGEEFIPVEGAQITAATVEMFNPMQSGECVIIDEAQMIADPDRGWAWTRAMMQCQAPEIHVIAPEIARHLIQSMAEAANIPIGTVEHERLTPIEVSKRPWKLETLPPKTILVAFSRKMVLGLKTELEALKRNVSVVYGSLPPEVRRKQAERFAAGETDICVATDAVGMGLNLPADYVCFYEVEKYDGREVRPLKPSEVQQIGGRAGRFGFSQAGEVGAMKGRDLKQIRSTFYTKPKILTHARVAPTVDDLHLIPGSLAERLKEWAQLQSIPADLRSYVKTADMTERIELASMLTDAEVNTIGMARALQLVNAPTRRSTRPFWYDCTRAILEGYPMPLPPPAPEEILDTEDLDFTETCIACSDIYLWLSNRSEFEQYGEHFSQVKEERREWSDRVDAALLRKLQMAYYRMDYPSQNW